MKRAIQSVVISVDPTFRAQLTEVLEEPQSGITLGTEIDLPFLEIGDAQLLQLRDASVELVFLDLEQDANVGIKLAQFLAEQQPNRQFIAVGPTLAPDQLLAAMRAGITEYLPKPVAREALLPALERVSRKLGAAAVSAAREPGRVLAFFGATGGTGTTTLAANLAVQLQQLTGKRTLLLDLGLELGDLALFLGVQPRFSVVDVVRNLHRMDAELLSSYLEKHSSGVHLLCAPYLPERAEAVSGEQIRTLLQLLKQHYDYVVVDLPRTFTLATLAALEQAEQIYLVATVDLPSLRNLKRILPLLERATRGGVAERVRLLVNRHGSAGSDIALEEVERTLGLKVFWKLANDYAPVNGSINTGEPLVLSARGSAFVKDLGALAAELSGLRTTNGRKAGLMGLRRFFGSREVAHG